MKEREGNKLRSKWADNPEVDQKETSHEVGRLSYPPPSASKAKTVREGNMGHPLSAQESVFARYLLSSKTRNTKPSSFTNKGD